MPDGTQTLSFWVKTTNTDTNRAYFCSCFEISSVPKLFSSTSAVAPCFLGCASSGLDSPKGREARPWHRKSGTGQRQRPGGMGASPFPWPFQTGPYLALAVWIKQRAAGKDDKVGQKTLGSSDKLGNRRPQLRPR